MKAEKELLVAQKASKSAGLQNRSRLCKNSEARPYVGVEREQRHSILELDDQFFDFSHRLARLCNRLNRVRNPALDLVAFLGP